MLVALSIPATTSAHEFWIEPLQYNLQEGQDVKARLMSGQLFKGFAYPYIPERIVKNIVVSGRSEYAIVGRLGDRPAIQVNNPETGLQILAYQSQPSIVNHNEWQQFEDYLVEEDLNWVIDAHKRRNIVKGKFAEVFSRYAKSLVQVGDVGGSDKAVGLPYELVALKNPFVVGSEDMQVLLLRDGKPAVDTQLSVFHRPPEADGAKFRATVRTDENGVGTIEQVGDGEFLLSAVFMTPADSAAGTDQPVWHSHWVSLTYVQFGK